MAKKKNSGASATAAGSSKPRELASGEGSSKGIKVSESQLTRSEATDAGSGQLVVRDQNQPAAAKNLERPTVEKKKDEESEPDEEDGHSGSDDDVPLPAVAVAMTMSEINTHRDRVVAEAKKYYTKKIGSKVIGVDQLLIVSVAGDPL
ncbi:hypothetical protein CASFOL_030472 [Castilleja foliolosa]|uniref:Uncharacterized protein n=1 Tax=Castilleja foliolosa TaxID=1961234 RepID=A0ABD3C831_9LAMI